MNSYQTVFSEGSYDIVNHTLSKVDIYHCSALPIELVKAEVLGIGKNAERKYQEMRYDWIEGHTGILSSLIHQSNFLNRLTSIIVDGDKPYTFRHRVNIINTLLDTGLDTNLPLHVSIGRNENFDLDTDLDIKNITSGYRVIIHPGHTRAVGSIFLNSPLKNSLIYINKEFSKQIKLKEYKSLTKIETPEQLISYYKPLKEPVDGKLMYSFKMGGSAHDIENFRKVHKQTQTPILKASSIKSGINTPVRNMHSSPSYLDETFVSFNNIHNLLQGKKINVYTNAGREGEYLEIKKKSQIFNASYNANILLQTDHAKYRNSGKLYEHIVDDPFNRFINSITTFSNDEMKVFKNFTRFIRDNKKELTEDFDEYRPNELYNFIETNSELEINQIPSRCNHKGIAIIVKNHKNLKRLLLEYLYCINKEVAVSKLENEQVVIINCEHGYWIGEKEYKEWIIPNTFEE